MTIRKNEEFAKELKGSRGARFCLCDFHVHSPASHDVPTCSNLNDIEQTYLKDFIGVVPKDIAEHQQKILSAFPPEEYLTQLKNRRNEVAKKLGITEYNQWAILAITDHNVCSYAVKLARKAWEDRKTNRLIIFPGIELDIVFPVPGDDKATIHILCIFSPSVNESDIRKAINDSSGNNWKEGDSFLNVNNLEEFVNNLRHHSVYPAMVIAAHIGSTKGIQKEVKRLLTAREASIAQIEAEMEVVKPHSKSMLQRQIQKLMEEDQGNDIPEEVLKKIGRCGFDALQVKGKADEKHYRRLHRFREEQGRSVPIVSSDAHCINNIFEVPSNLFPQLKLNNTFNKLDENSLFTEVRDHAIRCGETRFNYTYDGEVTHWIEGIEIVRDSDGATEFWSEQGGLILPFSRNLSCLIGGRGSGKSAIVEALSFLLNPQEAQEHGKLSLTKRDAWYMRARSTLSGCSLRLCWRAFGDADEDFHKGVFVSRYFDPNDRHEDATVTDSTGNTIISPVFPSVQLYRFHDIERAAEANGLRKLIDEVSGGVGAIEESIELIRTELSHKSHELIALAIEINDLTKDGSALRHYVKRSLDYARVNKPEVEKHFEKLDKIQAAGQKLKLIREQWDLLTDKFSVDDISNLKQLVIDIEDAIREGDGDYLDELSQLTAGDNAKLSKFINALGDLILLKSQTVDEFVSHRQKVLDQYAQVKDELERQGVPTGAKDREARKKELDEAVEALNVYQEKLIQFDDLYNERKKVFEKLKSECKVRTDLRVETADNITLQLKQDLDDSILRIEASAQPMEDKSDFEEWLDKNLTGVFRSYKSQRIDGLLRGGLVPEVLRDLLLNKRVDGLDILSHDVEKVSEGKVTEEDAIAILGISAISKYEPEVTSDSDNVDAVFYSELPTEIKGGLLFFPVMSADKLRLDNVLKLDEIVFNDIPIVHLNDRPQESGSAFRPLHELSPGQRCSAVLPILLLNGRSPLIIDQPEDNLDNRLIRQVIVNVLGSIKLRRQVIVATHNPNIPVLGDAEQTIVLAAVDEKKSKVKSQGNLDDKIIIDSITEIMEGGREAFQYRQTIYQAHWDGHAVTD